MHSRCKIVELLTFMGPKFFFLKKKCLFDFFCLFFESIKREKINMVKDQDKPHRKCSSASWAQAPTRCATIILTM